MVAKESKFIVDERSKETFHLHYCRNQTKAQELAKLFTEAVANNPSLGPMSPSISFPDCSIYEYTNDDGERCGLLVEKHLRGRFTKFTSNYHAANPGGASSHVAGGEQLLVDFVHAFSHWVYETTNHELVVCNLKGVLDRNRWHPAVRLTEPTICSRSRASKSYYGKSDVGMRGIRNFCMRHCCNRVCAALHLPPTKM